MYIYCTRVQPIIYFSFLSCTRSDRERNLDTLSGQTTVQPFHELVPDQELSHSLARRKSLKVTANRRSAKTHMGTRIPPHRAGQSALYFGRHLEGHTLDPFQSLS